MLIIISWSLVSSFEPPSSWLFLLRLRFLTVNLVHLLLFLIPHTLLLRQNISHGLEVLLMHCIPLEFLHFIGRQKEGVFNQSGVIL